MQIYGKMDELRDRIERNAAEIMGLSRKKNSLDRQEKRAKNDEAKKRIHEVQIVPVEREIKRIQKENRELGRELRLHELAVIRVEKERRETKGYLPTRQDEKSFSFLSRFRRFGNMEGFLAGREDEIYRELIECEMVDKFNSYKQQIGRKLTREETATFYKNANINGMRSIIEETVNAIYDDLCDGRATANSTEYKKEKGGLYRIKDTTPRKAPNTPLVDKTEKIQAKEQENGEQR